MDSRKYREDSKARFDAEAAEYAAMDDYGTFMSRNDGTQVEHPTSPAPVFAPPAPAPGGDLDVFTAAELEQQADLHYRNFTRMYDAAGKLGPWNAECKVLRAAADEQSALMRACHVELARRFAETTARNA